MIEKLDYKTAGVNLEAADAAVNRISELARATYTDGVLAGVGPFSGLFRLDVAQYAEPIIVSSCDGVGTKLKLAIRAGRHQSIGADLVNHCVDDILTCGAKPLTFLDYIALGRMEPELVGAVVEGVARACKENGMALIGGETAEMPGIYRMGEYDVAGFINGVVERDRIIDGRRIAPGQAVVGLASTGPHTNGYSLVRKVLFDQNDFGLDDTPDELEGLSIGEAVLAEHCSYLNPVRQLLDKEIIHGMAHVTGGGIPGNLVRILPKDVQAAVDVNRWPCPPVFTFLQRAGHVDPNEMFRVFNMGIGYILIVDFDDVQTVAEVAGEMSIESFMIGEIKAGPRQVRLNIPE